MIHIVITIASKSNKSIGFSNFLLLKHVIMYIKYLYKIQLAAKNKINKENGYKSVATIDSILNSPIAKITKEERTEVAM